MNREPIQRLTETQKLCLRHVSDHLTSKDIGRLLSCSPHTVDAHIRTAQKLLGTSSRFEAARILVASESGRKRPSTSQLSRIENSAQTVTFQAPISDREPDHVRIVQRSKLLPLPDFWGDEHDLSSGAKLGWMALCAIYICLSVGALVALINAVNVFYK